MKQIKNYFPALIVLLFFEVGKTNAQTSLKFDSTTSICQINFGSEKIDLQPHIQFFSDSTRALTINEVSTIEFANNFSKLPPESNDADKLKGGELFRSVSNKVYWLKFTIKNNSNYEKEWILLTSTKAPVLNTLYTLDSANKFTIKHSGGLLTIEERDFKHGIESRLNLLINHNEAQTFYLRLTYGKQKTIIDDDNGFHLWLQPKSLVYENEILPQNFTFSLYLGIISILALYNLILFFAMRERSYLFYMLYLLSLGITIVSLTGADFEFLYPNHPNWVDLISNLSASLISISYLLFAKSYLNTKESLPKWNRIFNIQLIILTCLFIIVSFIGYASPMIIICVLAVVSLGTLSSFILVLFPAFYCFKKGFRPARYFLLGNIFLMIGSILWVIGSISHIPFLVSNGIQIGIIIQIIFFSLGIGDKISVINNENLIAQEKVIKQLEENEKLKDTVNRELEQKVNERTAEVVKQKDLIEEHRKEIIDSITYAKRLQDAILPPLSEIKEYIPENFVLFKPKDIVAGDFYWAEKTDNYYFIAAADCTGHGVPGAMVSMVCSNALNRTVNEFGIIETGKILDNVRDLVLDTFKKSGEEIKDGMDISLCRIDNSNNEVQWSGANNPLWYFIGNELIEIKADKQPIGKYDDHKPFTTHSLKLPSGTNLYMFTDGYADQFSSADKKMTKKTFKAVVASSQNKTMNEQYEILNGFFESWKENTEQVDDVCVIGVRIRW